MDLSDNGITDISALNKLPHLVNVNLSCNRIASIPLFDRPPLKFIQDLDMSRNQLMSMENSDQFKLLHNLCLDQNLIRKMSVLDSCKYLSRLSLRHNGVTEITGVSNLSGLIMLDLSHNRIKMVDGIGSCQSLRELNLSHNFVTGTSENLPQSLRVVKLDSNNIADIESVSSLTELPSLCELWLQKNPLEQNKMLDIQPEIPLQEAWCNGTSISQHMYTLNLYLIHLMPKLVVLNGLPVTHKELFRANKTFTPSSKQRDEHRAYVDRIKVLHQYARIKAMDLSLATKYRPCVISGPAGVGKRTLTRRLLNKYPHTFGRCVSHTTRAPRPGEENGIDYHFVSATEMQTMIDEGNFVEAVSFFGNWYGNSFDSVYSVAMEGKICLIDLELEGVLALKQSHLSPRYVYISPPSYEILQERLESRVSKEKRIVKERKDQQKHTLEAQRQHRQQLLADQFVHDKHGLVEERSEVRQRSSVSQSEENADELDHSADGDKLVAQWLDKAQKDQGLEHRQEAVYSKYVNEEGFFDAVILNDDLETAFSDLEKFVMADVV